MILHLHYIYNPLYYIYIYNPLHYNPLHYITLHAGSLGPDRLARRREQGQGNRPQTAMYCDVT